MAKVDQNWVLGMLAQVQASPLNRDTLEEWKRFARNARDDSANVTVAEFKALLQAFILLIERVELATAETVEGDGTSGQDRKSYSDDQDRESYLPGVDPLELAEEYGLGLVDP